MGTLYVFFWGVWAFFFGAVAAVNGVLLLLHEEPLTPEIITCPYCRSKTVAIDYHLERRCKKRPKSLVIKPKSFRQGERLW